MFGLVVLASSSPLYGKVPRLILKKTNRLTQAAVFFRRHFLFGALLCNCSSAEREGIRSTYVQRECSAEPFMRSILCHEGSSRLSPVLAYDFLSRCKFNTLTSTPLYSSSRLYAQNPLFEIVHEESVMVYLHTCATGMFSRTLYA